MSEQLLEWFSMYGLPVYFCILVASSIGIPMPVKLMMLIIGAFVEQGEIEFWQALLIGSAGAVTGDQIGYFLGRYGGRHLIESLTTRFGGEKNIKRAEEFSKRWGGIGIFLSRWLVTPLGPWINLSSGVAFYSWTVFTILGIIGEFLWVFIYISLGIFFSDRVQQTADFLISLTWVFVGLTITIILGWKLSRYFQNHKRT